VDAAAADWTSSVSMRRRMFSISSWSALTNSRSSASPRKQENKKDLEID
jgi:hypothetical protein